MAYVGNRCSFSTVALACMCLVPGLHGSGLNPSDLLDQVDPIWCLVNKRLGWFQFSNWFVVYIYIYGLRCPFITPLGSLFAGSIYQCLNSHFSSSPLPLLLPTRANQCHRLGRCRVPTCAPCHRLPHAHSACRAAGCPLRAAPSPGTSLPYLRRGPCDTAPPPSCYIGIRCSAGSVPRPCSVALACLLSCSRVEWRTIPSEWSARFGGMR